jgi:hypothetical protein
MRNLASAHTSRAAESVGGHTIASGDKVMRNTLKRLALAIAMATVSLPALAGVSATCANQNFDSVTAPSLPSGWTSTVAKGALTTPAFATRSVGYVDSGINSTWIDDTNDYADVSLYSPVLAVVNIGVTPTISFHHSFFLWAPDASPSYAGAYDGAVLEMSINGGDFADVTAVGGSITAGGYNTYLDSTFSNPIAQPPGSPGRSVWSGSSSGFKTVAVTVPAAALNGTVQFRWRLGTEGGGRGYDTHSGWWIDSFEYSALGDVIFRDGFDGTCPN